MIRIKYKKKSSPKLVKRLKNKARIRKKVQGDEARPRLTVYRSGKHMYAQIVDDGSGKTLVSASTLTCKVDGSAKTIEAAKAIGSELAKMALAKNIKSVVFDRSGYVFHGRVKALADAARETGLNF